LAIRRTEACFLAGLPGREACIDSGRANAHDLMSRPSQGASVLAALLATSCGSPPGEPTCGDGSCNSEKTLTWAQVASESDLDLDVLFIVDDTSATAGSRGLLTAAYPQVAQLFEGILGGLPSIHLGVAAASLGAPPSCDVAASGSPTTRASACGEIGTNQFLATGPCGRNPDFTGSFSDALSCLADLGTAGCTPARPLAVAREILEASSVAGSGWTGFLRPTATLLLIFVAGQDDASGPANDLTDVAAFASYVRTLKSDPPDQILVLATAPATACTIPFATAAPRLSAFVSAFNGLGACTVDLATALYSLLFGGPQPFTQPRCLAGVRDTDPATPGLQADCVVDERVSATDGFWSESLLQSCDVSAPPCWVFTPGDDDNGCPGRLAFSIQRPADFCPQDAVVFAVATCLGCVDPEDPACRVQP
jgi:hypothetical protein